MFGLEIKKYAGNENDNFISTQIYPFNSEELRKKSEKDSTRYSNDEDDWDEQFNLVKLSDVEKEQILQFKTELKEMIEEDGGKFVYGTGKTATIMPRFKSSPTCSAIALYSNGDLKMNTELLFKFEDKIMRQPGLYAMWTGLFIANLAVLLNDNTQGVSRDFNITVNMLSLLYGGFSSWNNIFGNGKPSKYLTI